MSYFATWFVSLDGTVRCNIPHDAVCLVSPQHIAPDRAFFKAVRYVLLCGMFCCAVWFVFLNNTVRYNSM